MRSADRALLRDQRFKSIFRCADSLHRNYETDLPRGGLPTPSLRLLFLVEPGPLLLRTRGDRFQLQDHTGHWGSSPLVESENPSG